jgi:HK97 gp10 family phage protein
MAGTPSTLKVIFNRLPELPGMIKAAGDAHVQKTAQNMVKGMQERVAVDTGETRDSIHVEGSGSEAKVVVGGAGLFLEYGTIHMQAQPFAWPTREAEWPAYIAGWRAILSGTGLRSGSGTITPGVATTRRRTGGRLPR